MIVTDHSGYWIATTDKGEVWIVQVEKGADAIDLLEKAQGLQVISSLVKAKGLISGFHQDKSRRTKRRGSPKPR